jgi:prophage antirepressor-like protein
MAAPFAFDGALVRVTEKDGEPWFVAKDVCAALGIANHKDAVLKLDDDERDGVGLTDPMGRLQETTVISESGLYALALRCRDAMTPGSHAHRFRKWVTAEVLRSIRRFGSCGAARGLDEEQALHLAPIRPRRFFSYKPGLLRAPGTRRPRMNWRRLLVGGRKRHCTSRRFDVKRL